MDEERIYPHSVPRCVSNGLLSNTSFHHQYYNNHMMAQSKVHLISSDLWEAITGERLTPSNICEILEQAVPDGEHQPVQSLQYIMMARDRQGSRIIQKKLDESSDSDRSIIFNSLEPDFKDLIFDPCANFVIQKLCETATEKEQQTLLKVFLADTKTVVDHPNGCRVLQKFIETTSTENIDQLYVATRQYFLQLCVSPNGNHIVQRFIDHLPDRIGEIVKSVKPLMLKMAFDNCGCRIIQRLFDKYDVDTLKILVDDVMKKAVDLATNQYGNYVVQKILESGKSDLVSTLVNAFKGHFYEFSIHKFASNVMEKCIRNATQEEQLGIFTEVIGTFGHYENARILKMSTDQFGNYVIQRIIKHGNEDQQNAIYEVAYENFDELIACNYGKHVITRLKNLGYDF
ncbi:Pumilio-family RNA binding repeat containing protein [Tritrichomonas foetus]|uniref:Pumilio-family RNA binding repeat containing protein n=1 Tax=Tritrichomonas foetus TaxID=1144522 RepID=A0A1J4J2L5_9EUKA|nr:Pumilio-family RNA binding repeat containing protein [Tritrichomonas foetus]|eukprot:OHS93618.1 Pumilio-family RNA binding repeat containing protein [Tritrichomonas foetus]